jgi:hypothetical protein
MMENFVNNEAEAAWRYVATCWIIGEVTGRRVGTRYMYNLEEARRNQGEPGFRWRENRASTATLTGDQR